MNPIRTLEGSERRKLAGIGVVLISAMLIGLAPNAAKVAYLEGANPLAVITFRTVIGALVIALYLSARQQWPEGGLRPFQRSAIAGMAQVLTALGFLGAVAYIDVSLAALIFYFHPFLVAIVGHFRGDMEMSALRLAYLGAAVCGLSLVFGVTYTTISTVGLGLSVLGMIAITVLIFTVADVSKAVGPIPANFYLTLWSSIYLLVVAVSGPLGGWVDEVALPVSLTGWIALVGAGVTTTTGYVLFFVAARMIGTTRASIWSITEPVLAILLAILLVNEWLTPLQWLGVAIVIGSLIRFESVAERNG